jgi:hypothetical protein
MSRTPHSSIRSKNAVLVASVLLAACSATEGERPSRAVDGIVLIDDFEDANNHTLNDPSGYNGYWYTFNDQCGGSQFPEEGDVFAMERLDDGPAGLPFTSASNNFGARTYGDSGFIQWGAGMGVDLNLRPDQSKAAFDASEFHGVGFWGLALGRPVSVTLNVHEARTSQEASPLQCTPVPNPECGEPFSMEVTPNKCDDHFAASAVLSSDEWKWCAFSWDDLAQPDYVSPEYRIEGIDPSQLYALQFKISQLVEFDFVVDNVSFLTEPVARAEGASPCIGMSEMQ